MQITIKGEDLLLLPEKALFWPKKKILIISDLHVGKATHFRKNAIPVPQDVEQRNIKALEKLLLKYSASQVIFLGDLFHSRYNTSWELLCDSLRAFPDLDFVLVQGNHDFLDQRHYEKAGIRVVQTLEISPFLLTHEPMDEIQEHYVISGHIHPGIKLTDGIRKPMTLPCFWFGAYQAVVPAFGNLTGLYAVEPLEQDQVYVTAGDQVKQLQ